MAANRLLLCREKRREPTGRARRGTCHFLPADRQRRDARLHLCDGRGRIDAEHRRAEISQLQHPRAVHDRRHGDVGAGARRNAVAARGRRGARGRRRRLPRGRALHLALDAHGGGIRAARELDGVSHPVRESGGGPLGLRPAEHAEAVRQRRLADRQLGRQRAAARRARLLGGPDLGPVAAAHQDPDRARAANHCRGFQYRAPSRRRHPPPRAAGIRHQRPVRCARRRSFRAQLPPGASLHGRSARPQGHFRHGGRRHGQHLGRYCRRPRHRAGRSIFHRPLRCRFCRHLGLRSLAADLDRAPDWPVWRRQRRGARMSGYIEGVLVLLAINIVFAYGAFLPIAAGQLNLGVAGFAAIGGYVSAYLSNNAAISALAAIPLGALAAAIVALAVAVPVLRTRGIYLALATFALGEIVRASILNLEVVGAAAGYPVAAFIRFPVIAAFAGFVVLFVSLLFATRFGIAITAVHDDERVADLMGLNVRAFQVAAFVLGSALAGIGGGLSAHHLNYVHTQCL